MLLISMRYIANKILLKINSNGIIKLSITTYSKSAGKYFRTVYLLPSHKNEDIGLLHQIVLTGIYSNTLQISSLLHLLRLKMAAPAFLAANTHK